MCRDDPAHHLGLICTGDYPGGHITATGINSRVWNTQRALEKEGMPLHPLLLIPELLGAPGEKMQPFVMGKLRAEPEEGGHTRWGHFWGVSPLQWGHPRTPSPSLPVPGQGWVGLGCRMGAEHQPSPLCRAQGTHETQTVLCAQGIFLIPHPCAGTQQTRVPKAGSGKSCSRRDWGPIQDGGIQLGKKAPIPSARQS